MSAPSIMIACSDPALRDLLEMHLSDEGYRIVQPRTKMGTLTSIRRNRPDLVLLSLQPDFRRSNWRLLEHLHDDPAISVPVIAVTDPLTNRSKHADVLAQYAVGVLPLVFDRDQLLSTVQEVIGPATAVRGQERVEVDDDQERRHVVPNWPRANREDGLIPELTREQRERLSLAVGRYGLQSDTLDQIGQLTDLRRRVLLDGMPAFIERQELLATVDQELARLWNQRRKELVIIDPNLSHLPPKVLNKLIASNGHRSSAGAEVAKSA